MDTSSHTDQETEKSPRKRGLLVGAAGLVAALGLVSVLGAGDIIDLPAWANVPGVDLPLIGDKDAIDCRLSVADDTTDPVRIQIDIVDGNEDSYTDYQYVWNNGNLVDNTMYERPSVDQLIVPIQDDKPEQFFSVSIEPIREGRVYCESIVVN